MSETNAPPEMAWRTRDLAQIEERWDVLIAGGGITGAGIALEAARGGLRTLLVERKDFAWGTSSRSGKLVHGGLRYLKQGKVLLAYESVRARERLLQQSGGLVRPVGFLLPTYQGDGPGRLVYGAGLLAYDLLAGRVTHRWRNPHDFAMLSPHLSRTGLTGGFSYSDAETDDARLVLRVLREAVRHGASIINYVSVLDLVMENGQVKGALVRDEVDSRTFRVEAGTVVNATGAASDRLRARMGHAPRLRPLRGSHLIFPGWRFPLAQAVGFLHPSDRRPLYAVPWEGATLVGTTDIEHDCPDDDEPAMDVAELEYLMAALRARFASLALTPADAIATFSGVRPVVGSGKVDPSKESRDSALWQEGGLLTVTGGKLTTFGITALAAMRAICDRLKIAYPLSAHPIFQQMSQGRLEAKGLSRDQCDRLRRRYGPDASSVLAGSGEDGLTPLPGTNILPAEIRWAARSEWVVHLEDLLLRRVRLGILARRGGSIHFPVVKRICQEELGWNDARWEQEAASYLDLCSAKYSVPRSAEKGAGARELPRCRV